MCLKGILSKTNFSAADIQWYQRSAPNAMSGQRNAAIQNDVMFLLLLLLLLLEKTSLPSSDVSIISQK